MQPHAAYSSSRRHKKTNGTKVFKQAQPPPPWWWLTSISKTASNFTAGTVKTPFPEICVDICLLASGEGRTRLRLHFVSCGLAGNMLESDIVFSKHLCNIMKGRQVTHVQWLGPARPSLLAYCQKHSPAVHLHLMWNYILLSSFHSICLAFFLAIFQLLFFCVFVFSFGFIHSFNHFRIIFLSSQAGV